MQFLQYFYFDVVDIPATYLVKTIIGPGGFFIVLFAKLWLYFILLGALYETFARTSVPQTFNEIKLTPAICAIVTSCYLTALFLAIFAKLARYILVGN